MVIRDAGKSYMGGPNNNEKAVACLRSGCPWQRIIVFPALMRKEKGRRVGNVLIAMLNEHNERKAEAEKDNSRRYCEHLGTVKTDVTGHVDCPNQSRDYLVRISYT